MKKIIILMISICLFIFPFSVYAENCNSNDIIITSIELKNTTGNAEEIETSIENKKINMNVKLKEVGDSIEYEVKIKNNSNEEYYLNDTSMSMSNEYIDYTITYEDNSNIVQPESNKQVNIKVEYKEEVPDELLENNTYTQNNTITFDIANEKVTNPKTGNYFILICSIIILLDILFLLVFYKKQTIRNYLIILGILFIPITASAICNANLECETTVEIDKYKPICKRATTLHTATCERSSGGCELAGYSVSGSKGTTTITYGNLGTSGTLTVGDAFDCDVNNDGTYDPTTERFYYVITTNNKAVLSYYTNVEDGTTPTQQGFSYNASNSYINYQGPVDAYLQLPTIAQWSNSQIIPPGTRQIKTETGTTSIPWGSRTYTIDSFEYTNRAARFITAQEVVEACDLPSISNLTKLTNCDFFYENMGQFISTNLTTTQLRSSWIENPRSTNYYDVWYFDAVYFITDYNYASSTYGVRPVIEVLSSNIEY